MTDPYINPDNVTRRLLLEYDKHKSLVVALDFDYTINNYRDEGYSFDRVIRLMKDCKKLNCKIVIFSGSAKERYPEIRQKCAELGIEIDGINEDVISWHGAAGGEHLDWSRSKIFYNIFLDDRAGLESAYRALRFVADKLLWRKSDELNSWNTAL